VAIALLLLTIGARRMERWQKYEELPFAFFVFFVAGIVGDGNGYIQHEIIFADLLHESPTGQAGIASTIVGTVISQFIGAVCQTGAVIFLIKATGRSLSSIYISRAALGRLMLVALAAFVLFYLLGAVPILFPEGFTARLFPRNSLTWRHFFELTPALFVLVLGNGMREEIWFRALFLRRYGQFMSPFGANLLAAVIFASFHVQVTYTPFLTLFLGLTLGLGLLLGYVMQRSQNLIAAALVHAGSDIPIFLGYLSYAT
jgi:membrane protease YdiL (CAAX protease family)